MRNRSFSSVIFLVSFIIMFSFFHTSRRIIESNSSLQNRNQKDMPENKENQRRELYQLLGKLPDRHRQISVKIVSTEETVDMIIEKLLLDLNGIEEVPAYFTKPKNSTGKVPVVLFNHSHFGQYDVGKKEFIFGRKEMQTPPGRQNAQQMPRALRVVCRVPGPRGR